MRALVSKLFFILLVMLAHRAEFCFAQEINFSIPNFPAGKTVRVNFQVTVDEDTPVGTEEVRQVIAISGDNFSSPTISDVIDVIEVLAFILRSPVHFMWNSFLGMENVITLINKGASPLSVTASLLAPDGSLMGTIPFAIAGGSQFDVLVSQLPGFIRNFIGLVRLEFTPEELEASGMYYRFDSTGETLEFMLGGGVINSLRGESFVTFNTSQPSLDRTQALNQVSNWLQVGNLENSPKIFTVDYFLQDGTSLRSLSFEVPANGRRDIEAGHVNPGINRVGLLRITPLDPVGAYLAELTRFGSNATVTTLAKRFSFALMLPAREGSTSSKYASISSAGDGENYVIVANTDNVPGAYQVDFYGLSGGLLFSETLSLAPQQQFHYFANGILGPNRSGVVRVTPVGTSQFIGESTVYFRELSTGRVTAAYGSPLRELLPQSAYGPYNRYISQSNFVKVFNASKSLSSGLMQIEGASGSLGSISLGLGAESGQEIDISQLGIAPPVDSYGRLFFNGQSGGTLLADVLRAQFSNDMSRIEAAELIPVR